MSAIVKSWLEPVFIVLLRRIADVLFMFDFIFHLKMKSPAYDDSVLLTGLFIVRGFSS